MEIKELQKEIERHDVLVQKHFREEAGSEVRVQNLMLKIGEEYGELCEAVLARRGAQRKVKLDKANESDVGDELADLIVTALALAVNLDLDIEEILKDELETIRGRFGE